MIEGNDASTSQADGFAIGNGVNPIVRNNTANLTGGIGISLEAATFDELGRPIGTGVVEGNTANENREAGIGIADGAGHLIRNNSAYNNAEIGISAEGNVDGAGNKAGGNGGNPLIDEQCLGVVCSPGTTPPLTALDTTGPETTIESKPADPTSSTSATFAFSATDKRNDGSPGTPPTAMVFECRIDPPPDPPLEPEEPETEPPHPNEPPDPVEPVEGEGWMECISPFTVHHVDPGRHHFEVRASDPSNPNEPGDKDLTPASYDWTVDQIADDPEAGPDEVDPETRFLSTPPLHSTIGSATFRFSGSDNLTPGGNLRYECRLDGSDPEDWQTLRRARGR